VSSDGIRRKIFLLFFALNSYKTVFFGAKKRLVEKFQGGIQKGQGKGQGKGKLKIQTQNGHKSDPQ